MLEAAQWVWCVAMS